MNVDEMTPEQKLVAFKRLTRFLMKALKATPGGTATLGRLAMEDPVTLELITQLATQEGDTA